MSIVTCLPNYKENTILLNDLVSIRRAGASSVFANIAADQRITEDERKSFEAIINHFGLSLNEIAFDQNAFNKYYALAFIDQGVLPTVEKGRHDLPVMFKNGEVLHYGQPAVLRKRKRVTARVNYAGFTTSIKIARGLRYRAGSLRVATNATETLAAEDDGIFYLTNQRVGFIGGRKHFFVPYSKIAALELKADGLYVFKEGRENPYIVTMDDYEVALAIVSHILNS